MAQSCGKEVRLETEGQGTELDRTILEAIKDPLTHLVRNAVDHGIEAPEVRARAGKERCGLLRLRAFHQAGQVNLEISDDGAGLDLERIRNKAVESGRISPGQAARLSEKETCNLIFLPGLSTVEKVTNMSGRGVGMDVVKTNVEKIGGTVDLSSNPGQGTTVRVKIPLTLTIIPALMVTCCGERFAIPQVSLLELVRLEGQEVAKRIETVHGVPVHRLRGRLLPLVYLSRELGLAQESGHGDAVNLAVLQADDRQFGLVVDAVIDTQEIVVKPLGRQLKSLATYSGATIMGDGRVALILDIPGLAQRARVAGEARESGSAGKEEPPPAAAGDFDRQSLLLLQNGRNGRVAIPLSLVERLEKVPRSAVEHAGVQEVTQYRGQIMPLIRLSRIVPGGDEADLEQDGCLQVVVCSAGGRNVGLVADRILDIVEEKLLLQPPAQRPGVLGSAVIQQHVTDLLDVPVVLRKTVPGFSDTPA